MGSIVDEPVTTVDVEVLVQDGNADDKIAKIELLEDGVVATTEEPVASTCRIHVQSVHLAIQVHVTKQDGAEWLLRKRRGLV